MTKKIDNSKTINPELDTAIPDSIIQKGCPVFSKAEYILAIIILLTNTPRTIITKFLVLNSHFLKIYLNNLTTASLILSQKKNIKKQKERHTL